MKGLMLPILKPKRMEVTIVDIDAPIKIRFLQGISMQEIETTARAIVEGCGYRHFENPYHDRPDLPSVIVQEIRDPRDCSNR